MLVTPKRYFLVSSSAEGPTNLNVFDNCLIEAGIGDTNLIKMSSIVPPYCRKSEPVPIPPGSFLPVAYAFHGSGIPGEIISAAVAVALPMEDDEAGLIMEAGGAISRREAEDTVSRMAEAGFMKRRRRIKKILIEAVEHRVSVKGGVFAAVVLWE